jgi:hypothetical protein
VPAVIFEGEPNVRQGYCARCDAVDGSSWGTVLVDGRRHAYYSLHWHTLIGEGDILLTLGSFDDPTYADQSTFGGMFRSMQGDEVECELVDAEEVLPDLRMAFFGRFLTREEARTHDRVNDFWYYVDWLLANDPVLVEQTSGER